jgi:CTP synthase
MEARARLRLLWIDAAELETDDGRVPSPAAAAWAQLRTADGVLVPGGFGDRGVEGMVLAARHARRERVPYLGVCLGMQVAVIDFARDVLGLPDANSAEFAPACPDPVVVFMPEVSKEHMGGTMRLGARVTALRPDCLTARLYRDAGRANGFAFVTERHRHRYEVNPVAVPALEAAGLLFVGRDVETGERMEVLELAADRHPHPFFVGTQFHPEFRSRPGRPSPPFLGFIGACMATRRESR